MDIKKLLILMKARANNVDSNLLITLQIAFTSRSVLQKAPQKISSETYSLIFIYCDP